MVGDNVGEARPAVLPVSQPGTPPHGSQSHWSGKRSWGPDKCGPHWPSLLIIPLAIWQGGLDVQWGPWVGVWLPVLPVLGRSWSLGQLALPLRVSSIIQE